MPPARGTWRVRVELGRTPRWEMRSPSFSGVDKRRGDR